MNPKPVSKWSPSYAKRKLVPPKKMCAHELAKCLINTVGRATVGASVYWNDQVGRGQILWCQWSINISSQKHDSFSNSINKQKSANKYFLLIFKQDFILIYFWLKDISTTTLQWKEKLEATIELGTWHHKRGQDRKNDITLVPIHQLGQTAVIRGPRVWQAVVDRVGQLELDSVGQETHLGIFRHGFVVARLVEGGCIVVDVLDGNVEGANVVQWGQTIIRGLDGDEDELLVDRLVTIECVGGEDYARAGIDKELGSLERRLDDAVSNDLVGIRVDGLYGENVGVFGLLLFDLRSVSGAVFEGGLTIVAGKVFVRRRVKCEGGWQKADGHDNAQEESRGD